MTTLLKTTLAITSMVLLPLTACGDSSSGTCAGLIGAELDLCLALSGVDTTGGGTDTTGGGTDTTGGGTDTTGGGTDTTGGGTDTTGGGTDTTGGGTDTTGGGTDTTSVQRACSDNELAAVQTCAGNCAQGDNACAQACAQNNLSVACGQAVNALAQCGQANSCGTDTNCLLTNCPDQSAAVLGSGPAPTACDPITNSGCTAGTENCTFVSQTDIGCAPAGTASIDGECQQAGCSRGACLTLDNTNFSCFEFCSPANNQCPDGRPCNIASPDGDYTFCGGIPQNCDLFLQNCTTAGQGCYIVDQQGNTDCSAHGGGATGSSCTFINDCAPGNICAGAQGSGVCRQLCSTDGANACTTGTCTSVGIGVIGACQ